MENRSRPEFSNRDLVLGKNPLSGTSKKLLGHKARRGFDLHRLAFRASKELSDERHLLENSLTSAIFQSQKRSNARVLSVPPLPIGVTLFALGFFGRETGSEGCQLIPRVSETGLSRLVTINEDRIRFRVMRQDAHFRMLPATTGMGLTALPAFHQAKKGFSPQTSFETQAGI
jgi:hypothetical protein